MCRIEGRPLPSAGLDDSRMTDGLESDDDEKDQPAERRSVKRRSGIVGVNEEK